MTLRKLLEDLICLGYNLDSDVTIRAVTRNLNGQATSAREARISYIRMPRAEGGPMRISFFEDELKLAALD